VLHPDDFDAQVLRHPLFPVGELSSSRDAAPCRTGGSPGQRRRAPVRNLVMELGDRVGKFRVFVRDRAGQFAASYNAVLADVGIKPVKIPPRCPWANCYTERFVRTVKSELTDRMLILSQRHLDAVLAEYVRQYNGRRPHRSRELRPP
jgi:putative transposase